MASIHSSARSHPLTSKLGAAILLLLAALLLSALAPRGGPLGRPASGFPGSGSTHGDSQAGSPQRWAHAPANLNLAVQIPTWAGCSHHPCQYSHLAHGPVNTSVPFHSQFGEDAWLFRNVLHNRLRDFYLELGALNGRDGFNTRFFTEAAGWRGLLIEADPGMYGELTRNRPEALCVHAAVCDTFQQVHWHGDGFESGIWEFMSDKFRQTWHGEDSVEEMAAVPCVPLQYILDKFGIDTIDLWTLDVEGGELKILGTVDWSRLRVKVLVVETDGTDLAKDTAVVDLLSAAGFQQVRRLSEQEQAAAGVEFLGSEMARMNSFFVHRDAWQHLARAPDVAALHVP
ncbi:hypothetical protein ABPG75_011377 [Micractinium tetrahymenae]